MGHDFDLLQAQICYCCKAYHTTDMTLHKLRKLFFLELLNIYYIKNV